MMHELFHAFIHFFLFPVFLACSSWKYLLGVQYICVTKLPELSTYLRVLLHCRVLHIDDSRKALALGERATYVTCLSDDVILS